MIKNVVVTGSAQGIGFNITNTFAKKGFRVFALDIKPQKFENSNIICYKVDLRKEEEIKDVFDKIKKEYGSLHILINNAAASGFHKSIYDITTEEFDNVISINLRGYFICAKEFIKANKGESYGRIINIASTRYNQNEAEWEAYGASKGGVVSLTNTLCVSLSETPITVNAISPGWIEVKDYDGLTDEDHKQHPSGRVGKPSDIARACLFFCEEENDFINGANLISDGGMTKKMIYI